MLPSVTRSRGSNRHVPVHTRGPNGRPPCFFVFCNRFNIVEEEERERKGKSEGREESERKREGRREGEKRERRERRERREGGKGERGGKEEADCLLLPWCCSVGCDVWHA